MKKNIIAVLLVSIFILFSCGMTTKVDAREDDTTMSSSIRFIEISRGMSYKIVYCEPTKVIYSIHGGVATLLVNPDGTPMLYEGD